MELGRGVGGWWSEIQESGWVGGCGAAGGTLNAGALREKRYYC